jgi:S-adenosylmethionine:tRNA ribosyltransferase-isomerase
MLKNTAKAPEILSELYSYDLPKEKIALFPLNKRDESKLLVYHNEKITHSQFKFLPEFLPSQSLLICNNTKVIAARCIFEKPSGSKIEILLLEPSGSEISTALSAVQSCVWKCEIGNLKRWNQGLLLQNRGVEAKLLDREAKTVEFRWQSGLAFSQILEQIGAIPIPPYLNREAQAQDSQTYQTIYAQQEGAIAAPTAGLHFTQAVFDDLAAKQIHTSQVTLHVGAGTFKPLKAQFAHQHDMHSERVCIPKTTLQSMLTAKNLVCAGTTSLRTLESLYWFAVGLHYEKEVVFDIEKLFPYRFESLPLSRKQALELLLEYCQKYRLEQVEGKTSLLILPGYRFAFCDALITNFHQPQSTLMLLVAAFCSDWKEIYAQALANDYRFLSYGDSSLVFYHG